MKKDPYKHKERYLSWKKRVGNKIPEISTQNSSIILQYLGDMEKGINVSVTKGSRSYIRLNNLRQKIIFLSKTFEDRFNLIKITDIAEEQIFNFFNDMRTGEFKRKDGGEYKSPSDFVKMFKSFWHWWMKINRKQGNKIADITLDLDTSSDKPKWVYLTEEEVKLLCDNAKYYYKVLMMFLFDSGIRAPTELMNIKVSDFYNNFKEVHIREEVSKTFGRRIKLLLCSDLIKNYVKSEELQKDDFLFELQPDSMNAYIQRLAKNLLGDKVSPAGKKYTELTMYHFRHSSCCYWLPRYKSESALKYRFGWKKSDKIHYYSEMLGMKDTISEDDMLDDLTKTELERRLNKSEKEKEILIERVDNMENQMKQMLEMMKRTIIVSNR